MKLAGARVLLTGASSGIGSATARLLAARGAVVLCTGRDADALRAITNEIGAQQGFVTDLRDGDSATELAEWAGEVDVFIGNAGVGYAGAFARMPAERITELVTVNLLPNMVLARLLVPSMVDKGRGALVFLTSIAGAMGVADEAVYAGTKAGLRGFADSLRIELAPHGIQVNSVVPGVVDTPFFERRGARYQRSRPRPIPARVVAAATVRAIERNSAEVFAPAWLRFPARLNGAAPEWVRALRRIAE